MERSTENGVASGRPSVLGRTTSRQRANRLKPACEALDGRQLLSTVAAAPAVLPGPSATDVANAAATLEGVAATAFAQFQGDLAQAESHSHVTQAEVNQLAQDEMLIDQALDTSGLDPSAASNLVREVQGEIDLAFLGTSGFGPLNSLVASLPRARVIDGVGISLTPPASLKHNPRLAISREVVRQTLHEMNTVARAVHIPPRLFRTITDDFVGSGAIDHEINTRNDSVLNYDLSQVQVYFQGQIPNFVH
jgi:hypothetical protein